MNNSSFNGMAVEASVRQVGPSCVHISGELRLTAQCTGELKRAQWILRLKIKGPLCPVLGVLTI